MCREHGQVFSPGVGVGGDPDREEGLCHREYRQETQGRAQSDAVRGRRLVVGDQLIGIVEGREGVPVNDGRAMGQDVVVIVEARQRGWPVRDRCRVVVDPGCPPRGAGGTTWLGDCRLVGGWPRRTSGPWAGWRIVVGWPGRPVPRGHTGNVVAEPAFVASVLDAGDAAASQGARGPVPAAGHRGTITGGVIMLAGGRRCRGERRGRLVRGRLVRALAGRGVQPSQLWRWN